MCEDQECGLPEWLTHKNCCDLKSVFCCNLPGIINPIEAKQRKGKGAVGAYGSERTTQSLQDFPVVDSEEEAEEVSQEMGWILSLPLGTVVCSFVHSASV